MRTGRGHRESLPAPRLARRLLGLRGLATTQGVVPRRDQRRPLAVRTLPAIAIGAGIHIPTTGFLAPQFPGGFSAFVAGRAGHHGAPRAGAERVNAAGGLFSPMIVCVVGWRVPELIRPGKEDATPRPGFQRGQGHADAPRTHGHARPIRPTASAPSEPQPWKGVLESGVDVRVRLFNAPFLPSRVQRSISAYPPGCGRTWPNP